MLGLLLIWLGCHICLVGAVAVMAKMAGADE